MGRRIATSGARKTQVGQETVIDNWQPFQINGRRVTPARVTTGTEVNEYGPVFLPTINGFPMDHPSARLAGFGDVYLNVKFAFDENDHFIIDAAMPPFISLTKEGGVITYNRSYATNEVTMENSIASWKLGTLERPIKNTFRYFNGYKWQSADVESEGEPIYKKGPGSIGYDSFENEWAVVSLNVEAIHYLQVKDPEFDEWEFPLSIGRLCNHSNVAYKNVTQSVPTGTSGRFYGYNQGPSSYGFDLLTTLAVETPLA